MIDAEMVLPLNKLADEHDPYFYKVANQERLDWYTQDEDVYKRQGHYGIRPARAFLFSWNSSGVNVCAKPSLPCFPLDIVLIPVETIWIFSVVRVSPHTGSLGL